MPLERGNWVSGYETCPTCGGSGFIETEVDSTTEKQVKRDRCRTCGGSGQVRSRK